MNTRRMGLPLAETTTAAHGRELPIGWKLWNIFAKLWSFYPRVWMSWRNASTRWNILLKQ